MWEQISFEEVQENDVISLSLPNDIIASVKSLRKQDGKTYLSIVDKDGKSDILVGPNKNKIMRKYVGWTLKRPYELRPFDSFATAIGEPVKSCRRIRVSSDNTAIYYRLNDYERTVMIVDNKMPLYVRT